MSILAFYSNKGGVGKTSTAVNISYLAAQSGYRTLICDLDPQSSATYYFRVKPKLKKKARGFLNWNKGVDRSIKGTDYSNLDLLPADFTHRNLDISFYKLRKSKHRLGKVLTPLTKEYDLIILDCLSTINILAENIFNATDYLIVPMIPTTLSVRTYHQMLAFLKENKHDLNKVGAFFSMVDIRKKMHRELIIAVSNRYKGVFETTIPYRSDVEKMGIERQPVPVFAPYSTASLAYQSLWSEIFNKILAPHKLERNQ